MKSIGVIGVNGKAIAESANRSGFKTYLVDYFSDLDNLQPQEENQITHIPMQKDPLNPDFKTEYSREKLTDFAIEKLKGKVDAVLLASSVGSDYRMIEKIANYFKILGNDPGTVKSAKDWIILMKIFNKFNITYPETRVFKSFGELKNLNINYPVVIKPAIEKEFRMRHINSDSELTAFLDDAWEKFNTTGKKLTGKILVQEFINGTPISSSVLSNGKGAVTLTVNKQFIGIKKLNAPGRFTYCGHVTPANLDPDITVRVSEISNKIISKLNLIGSVGIDFVLKDNKIYFLEINPRFQDTIESVEKSKNINLVEKHINAVNGELEVNVNLDINSLNWYFGKGVLFADRTIKIGNLSNIPEVHDVPREGTLIREAEPVCTISVSGKSEAEVMKKLYEKVELINQFFHIE